MKRLTRVAHATIVLLLGLFASGATSWITPAEHAYAADCSSPGPVSKISVYSLKTADTTTLTKPDPLYDPRVVVIGEQVKYVVQSEDSQGCESKVTSGVYPTGLDVTILPSHPASVKLQKTQSGSESASPMTITISASGSGSSHKSFYATGVAVDTAETITASATILPSSTLVSATSDLTITAPAPMFAKLVFNDNAHGSADTISGLPSAVPTAAQSAGIMIKSYTSDGLTLLGSVAAAADGSFVGLPSGDDQYRQVNLTAVYAGTTSVESLPTTFVQSYPSIVSNLSATHDPATDKVQLAWVGDAGASFRVYRKPVSDMTAFSELDFLPGGTTLTPTFTDNTALMGVGYQYVVKQVNTVGSYTPEFLPAVMARMEAGNATLVPAGPMATVGTPKVTMSLNVNLYVSYSGAPLVDQAKILNAQFTNNASGVVYHATIVTHDSHDGVYTATGLAPYLVGDTAETVNVLPDGTYTVSVLTHQELTSSLTDSILVSSAYSVDTVAPTAPVLSKLRYANRVLTGLDGTVEAGVKVVIFSSPSLSSSSWLATTVPNATGGLGLYPLDPPASGIIYLVAIDSAGNISSAVAFDLTHRPLAPVAAKVTLQQNDPGKNDVLVGAPGAVAANVIVRVYASDPSKTADLVPVRELVAKPDGSFTQEVGDNLSGTFWVAVWSGTNMLSEAIMLSNNIAPAAPSTIQTTSGENSVTLQWSTVSGATFYKVTVYNSASGAVITSATVAATQTSIVLSLQSGISYTFSVQAVDAFGNVSGTISTNASAKAPVKVVTASAPSVTTPVETPAPAIVPRAKAAAPVVEAAPAVETPASTPAPAEPKTKNWAGIIAGIGIAILVLAGIASWYLWSRQESTTVVTTIKKPNGKSESNPAKSPDSKSSSGGTKPRW